MRWNPMRPGKTENIKNRFAGKWRITKMSLWDPGYCDEEVKAHITIERSGSGIFQFGYATGDADGRFKNESSGPLFDFTWQGSDECEEACGDGWMKIKPDNSAEGEIRFHQGDCSAFWARKTSRKSTGQKAVKKAQ